MTPSGYKIYLQKHPGAVSWQLSAPSLRPLLPQALHRQRRGQERDLQEPARLHELRPDLLDRQGEGFRPGPADLRPGLFRPLEAKPRTDYATEPSRPVLSPRRSLGSVIKLLTPSEDYTDAYNAWLASFPNYIYPIVFIIKRFFPRDTIGHWRELFGVDSINGFPGHELKAFGRKLVGMYLRVGLLGTQAWRMFKLRQDFSPAEKVQTEDDITASIVVPAGRLGAAPGPGLTGRRLQVRGQLRGAAVPAP